MPLVTVTARQPLDNASKSAILDAVHRSLIAAGVPEADRFQRVLTLDPNDFRYDPRYPDVPNILDQAKTPELRQALEFLFIPLTLGRALAGPPETPSDRLEILRNATMRAMRDPEFVEDVKKLNFDIEPMDAEETAKVANRLFATPAEAVARIRATVGP